MHFFGKGKSYFHNSHFKITNNNNIIYIQYIVSTLYCNKMQSTQRDKRLTLIKFY